MTPDRSPDLASPIARLNPDTLPDAGAVGYSQISVTEPGRLAFISGQVAWRPDGGATPADLAGQADLVLANARAALDAVGAAPRDIAMMRLYVTDISAAAQAEIMPKLMAFLDGAQPSLTGIGVAALAAPDLKLELEMTVRLPD